MKPLYPRTNLEIEINVHIFSESAAVVISIGFCVSKSLQNTVGLQQNIFYPKTKKFFCCSNSLVKLKFDPFYLFFNRCHRKVMNDERQERKSLISLSFEVHLVLVSIKTPKTDCCVSPLTANS